MNLRTAALLSALGIGCGPLGREYRVKLDPAFTQAYIEYALAAQDDWYAKTGSVFHQTIEPCVGFSNGVICVHASTMGGVDAACAEYGVIHARAVGFTRHGGLADGGETWIAVDSGLTPIDDQGTFAHELGHGMGLEHHPGPHLMDPTDDDNRVNTVQADDVAQWWSLR